MTPIVGHFHDDVGDVLAEFRWQLFLMLHPDLQSHREEGLQ
jgi:hypothetical protein